VLRLSFFFDLFQKKISPVGGGCTCIGFPARHETRSLGIISFGVPLDVRTSPLFNGGTDGPSVCWLFFLCCRIQGGGRKIWARRAHSGPKPWPRIRRATFVLNLLAFSFYIALRLALRAQMVSRRDHLKYPPQTSGAQCRGHSLDLFYSRAPGRNSPAPPDKNPPTKASPTVGVQLPPPVRSQLCWAWENFKKQKRKTVIHATN